jgi:acetylornithine deacetylase
LDVVEILCDLVRLPSVNPMGREASGDEFYEYRVTEYLQELFQRWGVPWQRQTVAPRRDNILARLDGEVPPEQGGPILMFEAHQDTVPVEGMTIPPWTPEVREGRVYGRGACDIKGGMACMLAALSRWLEERPAGRPTILMACVVDEEYTFSGAKRLPAAWSGPEAILPRAPEAAIVAEPTLLDVVVAHKGTVRWHCRTQGRAVHSSQPERGHNAIYDMARVVTALERYAEVELGRRGIHARLGRPTLSVGLISGGISVNVVPDRCRIEIDRRLLPGEYPLPAWEDVRDFIRQELGPSVPVEHDAPYQTMLGLDDRDNRLLAERLSAEAQACGAQGQRLGVPYGTDAPAFAAAGIPTVVFGPGAIEQAHTKDEWVAIEQLRRATEILYRFAADARGIKS